MNRRGFLIGICAAVAAPAIIKIPGILMPVRNRIDIPEPKVYAHNLLNKIENDIRRCLNSHIFEPNDALTRKIIRNNLDSYLMAIQDKNYIHDFYVACDGTNNPPSSMNKNILNVDLHIKPKNTISWVEINTELKFTK
jgi:Phage tail sheath C-terminal domain